MSNLVALRPGISKAQMRAATDSAHLYVEYFGDEVRTLSMKIACIGYFIAPRHRAEFLRLLRFIQDDLPLDAASIRCMNICLDILRDRFAA
jgi:hypothetical protein